MRTYDTHVLPNAEDTGDGGMSDFHCPQSTCAGIYSSAEAKAGVWESERARLLVQADDRAGGGAGMGRGASGGGRAQSDSVRGRLMHTDS